MESLHCGQHYSGPWGEDSWSPQLKYANIGQTTPNGGFVIQIPVPPPPQQLKMLSAVAPPTAFLY